MRKILLLLTSVMMVLGMAACGGDYAAEDEAVWQYETAIQYKFGTEWAKRWSQKHARQMAGVI